jgi:repressor LexA
MKGLTGRQRHLLEFIEDHVRIHGFPPSIREMADHMNIRSTNGVNDHLKALQKKGYIARGAGLKSRAISLLIPAKRTSARKPEEPVVTVPILGRVAAGAPILSDENFEGTISLGRSLLPANRNLFALRVRGDSMIDKGILDGDVVVVKSQPSADSGQIVVALLDGEATVKTFRRQKNHIRLEPANDNFEPIVIHRQDFAPTSILGVVTGVYRRLSH